MRRWMAFCLVAACGGGTGTPPAPDAPSPPIPDAAGPDAEPLPVIPADTIPCLAPQYWPLSLASADLPILVHYRAPSEAGTAAEVMAMLETSWRVEVGQLGFRQPLPDPGVCGPDGSFDVFLWRGADGAYVDGMAENPATAWDDWFTYMVVDPWGEYGGKLLDATLAHELNHACQASDDWWDSPIIFEMTSVFVEDLVYDEDDSYLDVLADFQAHPEWSLDRDDDYETWYMYGAALYLRYLRDWYFAGDGGFAAEMWLAMRSAPGTNEPDFEDALDQILGATAGISYLDSVVEFARWRWYTGSRDDGAHFEEGAAFPAEADVAVAARIDAPGQRFVDLQVMTLGSAYVEVTVPARATIAAAAADVEWVFQMVPGTTPGSDGTWFEFLTEPVDIPAGQTVIATALPYADDADPDDRTDVLYDLRLSFVSP